MRNEDDTGFPKLSAPARRALSGAGYTRLDQLAEVSESELKKLHGMGPTAVEALRAALAERGLSFRSSPDDTQTLVDHRVLVSVGSVGDACDNALAESVVDFFKTELIADRVWRSRDKLEVAIGEYLGWFTSVRIHQALGGLPQAEFDGSHAHCALMATQRGGCERARRGPRAGLTGLPGRARGDDRRAARACRRRPGCPRPMPGQPRCRSPPRRRSAASAWSR
jgi:Integrase core domain